MPNISVVKVTSPPVVDTLKVFTASFFRFYFEPILGTMRLRAVPFILKKWYVPSFRVDPAIIWLWCEHSSPTCPNRCSRNEIALLPMDGRTVILAVKCNVHDMLFLHGHLLVMLVSESLLFALSFLLVGQQQRLS
jgi:hypothetical protein